MLKIVIATHNNHKSIELLKLMSSLPITWMTLRDLEIDTIVEETGTTIQENATLKAREYARLTRMYTLADDSGLAIEALNGRPGVYSSRYGGNDISSKQQRELLLKELYSISWTNRKAYFRCTLALANPYGTDITVANGVCQGLITMSDRGTKGFGYDPIFYVPHQSCTMAEMDTDTKNRVGHRGKATHKMKGQISKLIS
ncbi:MAG TPA: RdgB/HAM1 family non-canonical purine NTP pyrophosphatase [Anaerolineales bacterium]|nr:RdgB/HAM1 family non-canonical purine NTP pyrophosphatase [Anaerolineales bacterium]|tara:strand:- start:437 stop:1036 length:600 start_codon:yes stop_codon:yes gene_type:complete